MRVLIIIACITLMLGFGRFANNNLSNELSEIAEQLMAKFPDPDPGGAFRKNNTVGSTCRTIWGSPYNDPLFFPYYCVADGEREGHEIFMTVDPASAVPGLGEVDKHRGSNGTTAANLPFGIGLKAGSGGKKGDFFILGDYRTPYYAGKSIRGIDEDFVYITNFETESVIRLHGKPEDYALAWTKKPHAGTAIFIKKNRDMIAHVRDVFWKEGDLQGHHFEYVQEKPSQEPRYTSMVQIGNGGVQNFAHATQDGEGNLYIAFISSPGLGDGAGSFCVAKISKKGEVLWIKQTGSPEGDIPKGIVYTNGHLYVSGGVKGSYGGKHPNVGRGFASFVAKFDAVTGKEIMVRQLPWGETPYHGAWALTADEQGNLYVLGSVLQKPFLYPYIASLSGEDLSIRWKKLIGSRGINEGWGNIHYVQPPIGPPYLLACGYSILSISGQRFFQSDKVSDAWVAKLTTHGEQIWLREFGVKGEAEYAWDCTSDSRGNVYTVGFTNGPLNGETYKGNTDAYIVKHDSNGNHIWTRLIGTTDSEQITSVLAVNDTLYVTGETWGLVGEKYFGKSDIWVASLTSDGQVIQKAQFGTEDFDFAYTLSTDQKSRYLYITGTTGGSLTGPFNGGNQDVYILRVDRKTLKVE